MNTTNAPAKTRRPEPARRPRNRRYLMCPPTYFDVRYSINPWMDPRTPSDRDLAMAQWEDLQRVYLALGHTVDVMTPIAELPDMVFAANGAKAIDGRVMVARFRHAERFAEAPAYAAWFRRQGYNQVCTAKHVAEGEGDYLAAGRWLLAGTGFRTDRRSHAEAQELFGRPVISLTLVDPRYYHLDTALAVLDDEHVMYYPAAFSPGSRAVLEALFPDAILADDDDARAFGLNAVSDGLNVVLPRGASGLEGQLRTHGYRPIVVDVSELLKAGGGVKCCTLELPASAADVGAPRPASRAA